MEAIDGNFKDAIRIKKENLIMKYYGFKFRKTSITSSNINSSVSTWIGLVGTFLFIVSAVEMGGFKGRMDGQVFYAVLYPAIIWFFAHMAVEHSWAKTVIVYLSGLAAIIGLVVIIYIAVKKHSFLPSAVLFLIFNIGTYYLARQKKKAFS